MNKYLSIAIQIVGALAALTYVQSAYVFITTHHISFIHYTASGPLEVWTIRNLGVRLLAIAVGFILALLLRNKSMLALMFAVRLTADMGDLINSVTTPNLPAMVGQILTGFVVMEALCLIGLIYLIKKENGK